MFVSNAVVINSRLYFIIEIRIYQIKMNGKDIPDKNIEKNKIHIRFIEDKVLVHKFWGKLTFKEVYSTSKDTKKIMAA